jgi:hypothetical protein
MEHKGVNMYLDEQVALMEVNIQKGAAVSSFELGMEGFRCV